MFCSYHLSLWVHFNALFSSGLNDSSFLLFTDGDHDNVEDSESVGPDVDTESMKDEL